MSIFKINPTDYQSITVSTNPSRYYSSSSNGVTGSIYVFPRRSSIEKDISPVNDPTTPVDESQLYTFWSGLNSFVKAFPGSKLNIADSMEGYLNGVNVEKTSLKNKKLLDVIRFTPSNTFTSASLKKLAIKDNLSHYYRTQYPSAHWGYSNYHSLNFFSSPTVPTSSVLLYPNVNDGSTPSGYATGRYSLSGAFSFDFYINPRYRTLDSQGHFKAGTIFHLSSSYALSLVTGSAKDVNGLPSAFRLQLQLSHSADISPSLATSGPYPRDLVFLSEDNALKWNNWHHVVVRWGTNLINQGTGSFNVDGVDKGMFVIPSGTILPKAYLNNTMVPTNPDVLCVGNYYEGRNTGNDRLKIFFNVYPSSYEGLYTLITGIGSQQQPNTFSFNHPLQSEIHDLSIKRFYVTDTDIQLSSSTGISNLKDVCFYLPPFFCIDSPIRKIATINGDNVPIAGVPYTPSIATTGMTTTPFNVSMAFGVDGHYINTENFLKDFSSNRHPRQLFLSASLVPAGSNVGKTANQILYDQPSVRRRNLSILPCDDGNFYPNYDVLSSKSIKVAIGDALNEFVDWNIDPYKTAYVDDLGNKSDGFINLNFSDVVFSGSRKNDQYFVTNNPAETENKENTYVNDNIGFSPLNPTKNPVANLNFLLTTYLPLAASNLQRYNAPERLFVTQSQVPYSVSWKTQDTSSNQVTFFDISNLFYGTRILPGSFTLTDSAMTGSGGAVSITIKDDGQGTLYRADSLTPHCKWNSVGTIFYNEGIIAIKSPHLYFFGKDQFEMSFKGEQNIHVLRIEALAPMNHLNSSSNPTYQQLPSSLSANEPDPNYVYITGINFHDDNLNVIMKTQLAQPIMKKYSDKIMFKVKYDF